MSEYLGKSDQQPPATPRFLTAREAAAVLNLSERTIRRAIQRGDLPASKWGGVFQIDQDDVSTFRAAQGPAASDAPPSSARVHPVRDAGFNTLPTPLTSLIGREVEVASLQAMLLAEDAPRLIVLTGPGGVGKSRLAVEVATRVRAAGTVDVVFSPLATIRDPGLVPVAIARSLGIRETTGRSTVELIAAEVGDRQILLVLDNLEQVVQAGPDLGGLLAACPRLRMLATSRSRLRLSGEWTFAVTPLQVDTASERREPRTQWQSPSPAVQLFVARAQAILPDFRLSEENADVLATICRRLDGLPLAIELAAARISALSPEGLLTRLDYRLPLLSDGPRDLPQRQQTMHAAIAWSYDLLSVEEQRLFRRLAVFEGGCTPEAAEAVCGMPSDASSAVMSLLASLVDNSLLRRTSPDEESRLVTLETVREFAWGQLQENHELENLRERHAMYFLTFAEGSARKIRSSEQISVLARLENDHDNLRAAMDWCLEVPHRSAYALRLAVALYWFWYLRDHYGEGRQWLERALEGAPAHASTATYARALASAGNLAIHLDRDYLTGRARLAQSISLGRGLNDPATLAEALHALAWSELLQPDRSAVRPALEESVMLFRQAGDTCGLATALCTLGMAFIIEQDADAAQAVLDESLTLASDLKEPWGIARALHYSGEIARFQGKSVEARRLYEASLSLYRSLGHRGAEAIVRHNLGYVALHQGKSRTALACFADGLATHVTHGDQQNIGHCIEGIAGTAVILGYPEQAAHLFGAVDRHFARLGTVAWPVDKIDHERIRELAGVRLGDAAFAAAYAAGWNWPRERVVEDAMALVEVLRPRPDTAPTSSSPGRPFGLTPRELEILEHVARHATDREIADKLSISRRTVMHHVSHILAKLGVSTRRDAAAVASRLELA